MAYLAEYAPSTPFASWLDGQPDQRFRALRGEAAVLGRDDGELPYLDFARGIDTALASRAQLEQIRQAEDADEAARASGPRTRRRSAELTLSNALRRIGVGTYVYGGTPAVDLASEDIDGLLSTSTASPQDVREQLLYDIGVRKDLPGARQRREPLPHMSRRRLTQLGLIS